MRHEFPQKVRRSALERSGGQCEAVGERYGHATGERCGRAVRKGRVHFDHYPRGAHDPHPDTVTLGNCLATCPECNTYANNKFDTPREAKMKAVKYKHGVHDARMDRKRGLDTPDPPRPRARKHEPTKMKSRPFDKSRSRKMNGHVVPRMP